MSRSLRGLRVLAAEAFRDALRRRVATVVAAVALVGLAGAETCTALGPAPIVVNGRLVDPEVAAAWIAPLLYGFQAWLVMVLAGILAAGHLAGPLEDGTAALWLARPVSRAAFAAARLAGALGLALAAGVLLLGGTAAFLATRHGLGAAPAVTGAVATAVGALTVAALAMAASLVFARTAVILLVVFGVPFVWAVDTLAAAGVPLGGWLAFVERYGPPLGTSVLAAVARWNPHVVGTAGAGDFALQLALWAVGSVALLVLAFRRVEISA